MQEIFIRGLELPFKVKGVTVLDANGDYNIYINTLLSKQAQHKAKIHELRHIKKEHFDNYDTVVNNEKEADSF